MSTIYPAFAKVPRLSREVIVTMWRGNYDDMVVSDIMTALSDMGSCAAPGFINPEGIMIFHTAAGQIFKKTFEKDEGKERAA